MKARLTYWVFGLSMLYALGAMSTPASAQVVVRVGQQNPHHYHHHHHHHHQPYQR
jgi:hypothetical protein